MPEALSRYWAAAWIRALGRDATPAAVSRVVAEAEFREQLGITDWTTWRRHLAGAGGLRRQQLDRHVRRVRARRDAPVPMLGVPGDRTGSMPLAQLATTDLPDPETLRAAVEQAARQLVADVQRLDRTLKRDTRRTARLLQQTNTRTRHRAVIESFPDAIPSVDPVWDRAIQRRVRIAVRHILAGSLAGRALEQRVVRTLVALPWRRRVAPSSRSLG